MKKLPDQVYKEEIESIRNNEVPGLVLSILKKQRKSLREMSPSFSDEETWTFALHDEFIKSFQTIIMLSDGTKLPPDNEETFLDIRTINVLIRSAHESYLTFNYLLTNGFFDVINADVETRFKWLCFKYAGFVNAEKMYRELNASSGPVLNSLAEILEKKDECLTEITAHPIFFSMDNSLRKRVIDFGEWRLSKNGKLSWNDLGSYSILNKWASHEYKHLSAYAHSSYISLVLGATHNKDVSGLLAYLYLLGIAFTCSFIEYFKQDEKIFTIRERAIYQELMTYIVAGINNSQ